MRWQFPADWQGIRRLFLLGVIGTLSFCGAYATAESAGLPPEMAADMVKAHNAYRLPLKLPPLKWSDKLAAAAQKWADQLVKERKFYHEPNPRSGENLFELKGRGTATPDDVVHDWASESLDYNYATNQCKSVCGHYTQMVWRSTREVGCAVAHGHDVEIWVCRYSPQGNVVGQKPY